MRIYLPATALKLFVDHWRWQDVPFYLCIQPKEGIHLANYEHRSWGPAEADQLLARAGHKWRLGCVE
jgi:glucose-6-phosphate 1-dehydrogenase